MTTKLTLSIDDEKLKKIKHLSKKRGSVSKYLKISLTMQRRKERKADFDINKIIGAFGKAPKNFDADKAEWDYLKEKHGL